MKHLDLLRFEGGRLRLHAYLPALIIASGRINIRMASVPCSNSKIMNYLPHIILMIHLQCGLTTHEL
jgi:hypothetical protein